MSYSLEQHSSKELVELAGGLHECRSRELVELARAIAAELERREACPGCGAEPGDGVTPGCTHELGCGYWRALAPR